MERCGALLLGLCLVAAQSRKEEVSQEPLQWMKKMERAVMLRNKKLLSNEFIRGLEWSLLNTTFSGSNLTLQTLNIHSLAFNLDCKFSGLTLSGTTPQQRLPGIGGGGQHTMRFPAELTRKPCRKQLKQLRLICIYFFFTHFFQSDTKALLLNNLILGAQLDHEHVKNLTDPIDISFWHNQSLENYKATCVFWKEGVSKRHWGVWSPEGCRTEHPLPSQVLCRCSHLSYFAVLMQLSPTRAELLEPLTYISIVGCSISTVASLLTLLMHFWARKQSDPVAPIHMNLQASLLLLNLAFLLSPMLATPSVPRPLCSALAATLHCALLSCFSWMAIEGFNLYLLLGRVYNIYVRRYVLKLCAVGWGIPVFLVLFLLAIKSSVYGPQNITFSNSQGSGSRNMSMCWVRDSTVHAVLVLGYGGLTCFFNLGVLVWVLWVLHRLRARDRAQEQTLGSRPWRDVGTVLGLTVLLGTTWGLGFFSFGDFLEPQLFLFTIFNSLHGFFLFLWFCFRWSRSEAKAEAEMETFSSTKTTR
ncbi:adhesion G-protein coupled receptor G5 isoform X1 [Erinaceus europaeus]|uniref:Adhesion G-protein coupled receptor G5 n=1 Tax=Erinaceus europaeus TaxID=9365 RepID=A0A1S2ZJ86_ERIEU|nr:adhesion G-protein coupled receptor G5 isoform X1 [Erinaceus europaeus]